MEYVSAAKRNKLLIWCLQDLNEYCWVEKANPKVLYKVWFYSITLWKWQNHWNGEDVSGCQGLGMGGWGREVGVAEKGQHEESSWDWRWLYLDGITVAILVGILYYNVEGWHHEGKLGERYIGLPWIRWIYNYLKIKKSKKKVKVPNWGNFKIRQQTT